MNKGSLLPPQSGESSVIITPLLDLMFLVLIFFALNLSFQPLDSLDVQIPETENLTPLPEDESYLLIELNSRGEISIEEQRYSLTELRDLITLRTDKEPDLAVYVAGDQQTRYRILMKVLDILTQGGAQNIHLLTEEE